MESNPVYIYRMARRLARRFVWGHPHLCAPLDRDPLLRAATEHMADYEYWLDGYPRSGNTFAARALARCLPTDAKLRSHTHRASMIIDAIRHNKPGIFVIRPPREAALSWSVFTGIPVGELLSYYVDFHRVLLPYRERMVVAPFREVTKDFGQTIARFTEQFGVACRAFTHDEENVGKIFSDMENASAAEHQGKVDETTVWRPSPAREALKAKLSGEVDGDHYLLALMREGETLYRQFTRPAPAPERDPALLVVLPTLGRSQYLHAAAASIRELGFAGMQLVMACPAERVEELGARFPDFKVVADAGPDGGLYGAINAGLAAARPGWEWFTYLNDDDLLTPAFAETARQHCRVENTNVVAYGDIQLIDRGSRSLGHMTVEKNPYRFRALLQGGISPVGQQGMLFSEPAVRTLGGYRPEIRLCGDLDFWARAYAAGYGFRHYNATVGQFRLQPGQLSGNVAVTKREQDEITGRCFPDAASPLERWVVRTAFRLRNAGRYVGRWRAVGGWRRSNELLEMGGERSPAPR